MGYSLVNKFSLILPLLAVISLSLITFDVSKDKILLIGILSAPHHFELRETLRQTWLKDVGNDILYYFLVGKHMCNIPLKDRIDEGSCTELPIFVPQENKDHLFQSGCYTCYDDNKETPIYFGYSFTIQNDIIIKSLGIVSSSFKGYTKVYLVDGATGHRITSATFLSNTSNSKVSWKNVEKYRLPKGFEGRILWEGSINPQLLQTNCGFNWQPAGNIFAFHMYWTSNGLPAKFHNASLTPVTIGFEIPAIDNLENFQKEKSVRIKQWKNEITSINTELEKESRIMGDILFLDVVDVYRSLPKKMLEFYKWANTNIKFSYLLKTDDDTFINITAVKQKLHGLSQEQKDTKNHLWWWSAFREGWTVQWAGKWRETHYRSFSYPPFPCGAGYIISKGIVSFLSTIADQLCTQYQGEDVALGIWLSATNPSSPVNKGSCVWTCDKNKNGTEYCNYAQLSTEEIKHIYHKMQVK